MNPYNGPIIGHENVINFLNKSVQSQNISHAYLFSGLDNMGKTTILNYFIASLVCLDKNKNIPCGECVNCEQIEKNIYPDVYEVNREKNDKNDKLKKNISIEQIKNFQVKIENSSFSNSYKIGIINEADTMSKSSANALLKTLEEPKGRTIIFLKTSKMNLLPKTIVSRCQILNFFQVSECKIFQYLTKQKGVGRDDAKIISKLAQGRPGLAIKYLGCNHALEKYKKEVVRFMDISKTAIAKRFEVVEGIISDCKKNDDDLGGINNILEVWTSCVRDAILVKNNCSHLSVNFFAIDGIQRFASHHSNSDLLKIETLFKDTRKFLGLNVAPRLALENLVLNL